MLLILSMQLVKGAISYFAYICNSWYCNFEICICDVCQTTSWT